MIFGSTATKRALLSILLFAFPAFAKSKAPQLSVSRKISAQEITPQIDPVQINSCLDNLKLEAWNARRPKKEGDPKIALSEWHRQVDASNLPTTCETGNLEQFKQALKNQIATCKNQIAKDPTHSMQIGCRTYTRQEWCLDVNTKMLELANVSTDFPSLMKSVKPEFDWLLNTGRHEDSKNAKIKKGDVQFTAYYTTSPIEASSVPTEKFSQPFYRVPPDLVKFKPEDPESCGEDKITGRKIKICRKNPDGTLSLYPERREILEGKILEGRGLEIGYVEDPIDVIILMLEGSGSLNLRTPDGKTQLVKLTYGISNGRTNHFLSRIMRCMGASTDEYASIARIRKYMSARSDQLSTILAFDQYYSFFFTPEGGPFGIDNIPVTALHTLATDRSVIPTGSVIFFKTSNPEANAPVSCKQAATMAVAQDIGGAIVGAHVDWYMGEGAEAQERAERINSPGSLFLALPRGAGKAVEKCSVEKIAD